MKRILLYILLASSFLLSCETNIPYEGEHPKNFLVLNCQIFADSTIMVLVTKSNTIVDPDRITSLEDANVKLFENGMFIENLTHIEDGIYLSDHIASENLRYRIEVSHHDYNTVYSEATVPGQAVAEIITIKDKPELETELKLKITDSKEKNYYKLDIYIPSFEEDKLSESTTKKLQRQNIWSEDPVLNYNTVKDEVRDAPPNKFQIFDDDLFNGEEYVLTFSTHSYYEQEGELKFHNDIKVNLECISKELFMYYKTLDAQDWYGESPFSEPVRLHTNIINGSGILGACNANYIHLP